MNEFLATNSKLVGVVAIAASLIVGAWLFRNAYADYKITSAPIPQTTVGNSQNSQPQRQVDVNRIVRAHLFGDSNKPAAPKKVEKPEPKPAPETKLNVTLLGLIGSNDGKLARAIIKLDRGQPEVVAIGDDLGNTGAVVSQILSSEMIIERAGVNESVKLAERKKRLQSLAMKQPDNSPELFERNLGDMGALPQPSEDIFAIEPPPIPAPSPSGSFSPNSESFDQEFEGFPEDFPEDIGEGDFPGGFPEDFPNNQL